MITTRRGMFLAAPASHALVAFAACATGAGCGIVHGPNRKDGQRKEKRTYYIAVSRCSLAHRAGLTEIETLFESLVTMHKRIELRTPRLSACGCRTLEGAGMATCTHAAGSAQTQSQTHANCHDP